MAPSSKAQQAAVAKYESKVYGKILLRLPKGKKELIKNHAEKCGESVNGFIARAIDYALDRENSTNQ